jgi:hypothetical protein
MCGIDLRHPRLLRHRLLLDIRLHQVAGVPGAGLSLRIRPRFKRLHTYIGSQYSMNFTSDIVCAGLGSGPDGARECAGYAAGRPLAAPT